jgi:hypothetical protein
MNLVVWTGTEVLEEMTVERQVIVLGTEIQRLHNQLGYGRRMINKMLSLLAYNNAELVEELNAALAELGHEDQQIPIEDPNELVTPQDLEQARTEIEAQRPALTKEQQRQLDFYYRRLARMCHPDTNPKMTELHDVMPVARALREAGDVESLRSMYESIKAYVADLSRPGGWMKGLKKRRENLENTLRMIRDEIQALESSEEFAVADLYTRDPKTATAKWRANMRVRIDGLRAEAERRRMQRRQHSSPWSGGFNWNVST